MASPDRHRQNRHRQNREKEADRPHRLGRRLDPRNTVLLLKGALCLALGLVLLQAVGLGWIPAAHPLANAALAGAVLANGLGTIYFLRYLYVVWFRR